MFILDKRKNIETEQIIMNSNPTFNLLSVGKESISYEDILSEHEESPNLKKERYLVKLNDDYIGILDFTMCNPNDSKPWLGLFILHNKYQGIGMGNKLFNFFEELMIKRGVKEVRLGCLHENKSGMAFWFKQGFKEYKNIDYKGRAMSCLSKNL